MNDGISTESFEQKERLSYKPIPYPKLTTGYFLLPSRDIDDNMQNSSNKISTKDVNILMNHAQYDTSIHQIQNSVKSKSTHDIIHENIQGFKACVHSKDGHNNSSHYKIVIDDNSDRNIILKKPEEIKSENNIKTISSNITEESVGKIGVIDDMILPPKILNITKKNQHTGSDMSVIKKIVNDAESNEILDVQKSIITLNNLVKVNDDLEQFSKKKQFDEFSNLEEIIGQSEVNMLNSY